MFQLQWLCTEEGYLDALHVVHRVKPGGLIVAAPDCSSFVWMNSSNHQRCASNDWYGDLTYDKVQIGNCIADATVGFILIGAAKGCHGVLENPPNSALFKYGPVRQALADGGFLHETCIARCAYSTEPYGSLLCAAPAFAQVASMSHWQTHLCSSQQARPRKLVKSVALAEKMLWLPLLRTPQLWGKRWCLRG